MLGKSYLDAAQQGKNDSWYYVVGTLVLFLCGVAGILVQTILAGWVLKFDPALAAQTQAPTLFYEALLTLLRSPSPIAFALNNVPYLAFLVGIAIAVKLVHRRPFRSLVSAERSIRWRLLWQGFWVWFVLVALAVGIEFCLAPGNFSITFDPMTWFPLLGLAVVLTPLQTAAEEFIFRGYLLQGLGNLSRQPVALMMATSFLFSWLHLGNPEMQRSGVWVALLYFAIGVFLAFITLLQGRLELALGVHAANNLFVVLVVNATDSALPSPALITQTQASHPAFVFALALIGMMVFYYWVFEWHRQGS